MTNFYQRLSALMLTVCMGIATITPAYATNEVLEDNAADRPSTGAMVVDAIIARPLMLIATVAGSAIFVATLPFSVIGGNAKEAANTLVLKPANYTFTRCLGCSSSQNELKEPTGVQTP